MAAWLHQNDYVLASPGWSVATPLARFTERHEMGRMPEASSEYWGTMHRLVALGRLDEALKLLGLHSAWEQEFTLDDKSIAVQVRNLLCPLCLCGSSWANAVKHSELSPCMTSTCS